MQIILVQGFCPLKIENLNSISWWIPSLKVLFFTLYLSDNSLDTKCQSLLPKKDL